jgi:hypothetical protein
MYSPAKTEEHPRTGTVTYRDDSYFNVFGCGFNVFVDKKHLFGFTGTISYPIFLERIANRNYYNWLGIVYSTGFTFKVPLSKKKNSTEVKK